MVKDPDTGRDVLEVAYPAGKFSEGVSFRCPLRARVDRARVTWKVKFAEDFAFVLGGKAGAGLLGGRQPTTAGVRPNGRDYFSVMTMWAEDRGAEGGGGEAYVYYPDQTGDYGDGFAWNVPLPRGTWLTLTSEVVLNDPGRKNGSVRQYLNGRLVVERTGLRFRDVASLRIEEQYFNTFFGGNTAEWAPAKPQKAWFDSVRVEAF